MFFIEIFRHFYFWRRTFSKVITVTVLLLFIDNRAYVSNRREMSSSVKASVEAYFASLNSTCSRMMADISTAKQQHCENWENLSSVEQAKTLWDTLVKPEIASKYKLYPESHPDVEYFPILRIMPGEKIIVDEDPTGAKNFTCSWRDEHSAPFHWETVSQLNLLLCESEEKSENSESIISTVVEQQSEPLLSIQEPENFESVADKPEQIPDEKKDEEVKRPVLLKRPEVPPPPVPPHAVPPIPPHASENPPIPPHAEKTDTPIYAKVVKRKSSAKTLVISEMKAHKKAVEEMKPAIPPRMSLELRGDIDHMSYRTVPANHADMIPKTGFDFLDNW